MTHLFRLGLFIHRKDTTEAHTSQTCWGLRVNARKDESTHPALLYGWLCREGWHRREQKGLLLMQSRGMADTSAWWRGRDVVQCGHELGLVRQASGSTWPSCLPSVLYRLPTPPPPPRAGPARADVEYLQLSKLVPHPLLSPLKHAFSHLALHPSPDGIFHSLACLPASDLSCL